MAVAAGCKKPAGGRGHVEKHVETPRGERTREETPRGKRERGERARISGRRVIEEGGENEGNHRIGGPTKEGKGG